MWRPVQRRTKGIQRTSSQQRYRQISKFVVLAGLIIGGLAGACSGYLIGFDDIQYHRDAAGWLNLSGLGPWAGLIIGGMLGIVAGVAQVFMLESVARLPFVGCLAVFLIVDGAICTVIASNVQIDEAAIIQRDNSIQAAVQGQAKQTASDYSTLSAHLDDLQYPGSSLYHWRTDDPFQFTTEDDQNAVAAYYQRVLGAPLQETGSAMGPADESLEVVTNYDGVPIQATIGDDDLGDGSKTKVTISETTAAAVSAWTAANRSTASSSTHAEASTQSTSTPTPPKAPASQSPSPGKPSASPTTASPAPSASGTQAHGASSAPTAAPSVGSVSKATHT